MECRISKTAMFIINPASEAKLTCLASFYSKVLQPRIVQNKIYTVLRSAVLGDSTRVR